MKKILIALLVLGLIAIGTSYSNASSTRTISHKFRTFTTDTSVAQGATIFRITGYTTSTTAIFGIHNTDDIQSISATTAAVEGGEASSGDALPHYYFGEDGLDLDSGMTVKINDCVIVVEYI